ncbi:helix-turn-helix transcriptional regulator [Roseivivax marinus]|uniref:helix-turn-helix transcriptional regulator n=1 Tax=Roseivivax marinus TaxID=1379903 RepID=UPI00273ECF9D|nr:autoinducer binding domain-containing protein [Roseivivax marinus]
MRTTRIANLVIDTADALGSAQTVEERWWAITRVANSIGAEAVNIGGFNTATREVCWVRSTKDPMWLEEYDQAGFASVDPLVRGAVTGDAPRFVDIVNDAKRDPGSGKLRDWRETAMSYGYNYLIAEASYEGAFGSGVALSCRSNPNDLFGPGTLRAFSAISAMIATSLIDAMEPEGDIHDGWAYGATLRQLLAGERDVIALMANGLPEYMIADVLKITEFEVWRRLRSASLKLKAKNKAHAVALAVTLGFVQI